MRNDRGAATVELALVLPFLLLILFGIVDFSRAYLTTSSLTHAAREGVREVALGGTALEAEQRTVAAAARISGVTAAVEVDGVAMNDDYVCAFGNPTTLAASAPFEYVTPIGSLIARLTASSTVVVDDTTLTMRASMRCGG